MDKHNAVAAPPESWMDLSIVVLVRACCCRKLLQLGGRWQVRPGSLLCPSCLHQGCMLALHTSHKLAHDCSCTSLLAAKCSPLGVHASKLLLLLRS